MANAFERLLGAGRRMSLVFMAGASTLSVAAQTPTPVLAVPVDGAEIMAIAPSASPKYDAVIKGCQIVENAFSADHPKMTEQNITDVLAPVGVVNNYLLHMGRPPLGESVIAVVRQPLHGTVSLTDTKSGLYTYKFPHDFYGQDSADFLVEANGKRFLVRYFIEVGALGATRDYEDRCQRLLSAVR